MKEIMSALVNVLQRAQETLRDEKSSIKNSAALRNLITCKPILENENRWIEILECTRTPP